MWGGDPLTTSEKSLSYLTNPEVLSVNQQSSNNRQVFGTAAEVCWVAQDPDSGDRFVALFNLSDQPAEVALNLEWEGIRGKHKVRDLWRRTTDGVVEGRLGRTLPAHGAGLYRLSMLSGAPTE